MSSPEDDKRPERPAEERDWVDRSSDAAGKLGFNAVRVRWKLEGWRKRWRQRQREGEARREQGRYEHQTCAACGALQAGDERTCSRCGEALPPRALRTLGRLGGRVPSMSVILSAVLVGVYGRMLLAGAPGGEATLWSFASPLLIEFGGNLPMGWNGDEWWRFATSVLLHGGIMHLAFNLYALAMVGPLTEKIYGRWYTLLLFLLTGVLASLGSSALRSGGVAIGASGAIMGLIGVATAWGHRQGTTASRALRNGMLRWALMVMIFGFFINADNVAHGVGFATGLGLGLGASPRWLLAPERRGLRLVVAVVAALALVATAVAALVPLSTRLWS